MFKIAASSQISYFSKCAFKSLTPSDRCVLPGANAEILGLTLSKAAIPYQVLNRKKLQKKFNLSSAVDLIQSGFVDTSSAKYILVESRMNEFDFSYPIDQMEPVFVVAKRKMTLIENALMPMYTFDGYMWLAVFVAFFALIMSLFLFKRIKAQKQNGNEPLCHYISQGLVYGFHSRNESTTAGNIVAVVLGVTVLLITRIYCAGLLTVLLHPPHVAPFKDSWEMLKMVQNNQLSIVSNNISWYMEEMRASNHQYYQRLRIVTQQNPIVLEQHSAKRLEMVKKGQFIMPVMHNVRTVKLLQRHCVLTFVTGHDLPTYWTGFLFKKNSTWLPQFNKALAQTREGFANVNKKYTTPVNKNCEPEIVLGGKPFDIYSLSGAGALLISGIFAGFCALVVEKCMERKLIENNVYQLVRRNYNSISTRTSFT